MNDEERAIMEQHMSYWNTKMNEGKVVAYGPVLDPKAIYGLGIIAAKDDAEVRDFIQNDPAVTINRYEYFPMMAIVPSR